MVEARVGRGERRRRRVRRKIEGWKHIYFPNCQVEWNGMVDGDVLLSMSIFVLCFGIRINATLSQPKIVYAMLTEF